MFLFPAFSSARRRSAFTLIELLTVVAIIGILAAITFGVSKGVNERAAINQAKAELATIAAALDAYKRQYGDYPQIGGAANNPTLATPSSSDAPGILFNALVGKRGPSSSLVQMDKKSFVQLDKMSLQVATALPAVGSDAQVSNAFVDPWGRRYLYYYKTSSNWRNPSFLLFSVGPDGTLQGSVPADGFLTPEFDVAASAGKGNADNIYANR